LYTLIANTSGPFGNAPLPPIAVVVSSFNSNNDSDVVLPGFATKENTCSPGNAYCGSPNWKVVVAAAAIVALDVWVNETRCIVVVPSLLGVTADTEVPAGNCV
jgi:hypothetical protein